MIFDIQSVARSFGEKEKAQLEMATKEAELRTGGTAGKACRVCPEALAVPTNQPLDSFDARTYPASYVEWWFGDGAPGLERERPMLFEQVARRLINLEEMQYSLASDTEPYEASPQSRFATPEIIAVLGDVVRRLRLLRGTRAAVGRKGFSADLRALADASSDDFLEAMNIAGPKESICSAAARPEMPAKVKTALRTLLLSTSDVVGTEGRKAQLRYNGHGNNIFFGAPSFFATPNFADTYNPLVKLLHDGPGPTSHLDAGGAPQAAGSRRDFITAAEPPMPSLRRMHEIVAQDPRAQAKFFLLMSELHYRYIVGIDRLHIGRLTLARPPPAGARLRRCVLAALHCARHY